MKKLLQGFIAVFVFAIAVVPVFAGNQGDGSGYGTQPGFEVANENTECAGHGSFGYFGKDWNLGNEVSGHYKDYPWTGANGYQTGLNNSGLCGNRQGNL